MARAIRAAGGDYLLAVKGNQPTLHDAVRRVFTDACVADFAGVTFTRAPPELVELVPAAVVGRAARPAGPAPEAFGPATRRPTRTPQTQTDHPVARRGRRP